MFAATVGRRFRPIFLAIFSPAHFAIVP